jgi:hypothetical protein
VLANGQLGLVLERKERGTHGLSLLPAMQYRDANIAGMYDPNDIIDDIHDFPPSFNVVRTAQPNVASTMTPKRTHAFKPLLKSDFATGEVAPPSKKREAPVPVFNLAKDKVLALLAAPEVHDCDDATICLLRSLAANCSVDSCFQLFDYYNYKIINQVLTTMFDYKKMLVEKSKHNLYHVCIDFLNFLEYEF